MLLVFFVQNLFSNFALGRGGGSLQSGRHSCVRYCTIYIYIYMYIYFLCITKHYTYIKLCTFMHVHWKPLHPMYMVWLLAWLLLLTFGLHTLLTKWSAVTDCFIQAVKCNIYCRSYSDLGYAWNNDREFCS
jgi:hypothetical protein